MTGSTTAISGDQACGKLHQDEKTYSQNCLIFPQGRKGRPHGRGHIQYFTDDALGRYNYSGLWKNGRREDPDAGETHFREDGIL